MHRDVKPPNASARGTMMCLGCMLLTLFGLQVLLSASGLVKLCDFGICKVAVDQAHLNNVTTVVGCNVYLPVRP